MENKKIIAIIGIVISICLIGLSVYKIIETSNKINSDTNGEVLNKNTKVKGDLKTNTEENNSTINNNEVENETNNTVENKTEDSDNSVNELKAKYEKLIYSTNEDLYTNGTNTGMDSKLVDVDIVKIEEKYVNEEFNRYEIKAKYKCENGGYHCIYISQIVDDMIKDSNGYYDITYYTYDSNNKITTDGISVCPGCTITKKTIYEK